MDTENQTAENTAETSAEEAQTSVNYDAGWDDAEDTAEHTEPDSQSEKEKTEPEDDGTDDDADEQNESDAAGKEDEKDPPADQPQQEKPVTVHVKYMDTEKDLSIEEAAEFAQKGMDYDRIRERYDESKPVMELMKSLAERSGMNVPDFVNFIRLQSKQAEGMDEDTAKSAIALEDREAAVSAKEKEQKEREALQEKTDGEEERIHAEILRFTKKYPDVKPESVPQEVWQKMAQGESLVESYQDYMLQKATADAEAAKQAAKNKAASAGSMRTAGNPNTEKDPMDAGWDT